MAFAIICRLNGHFVRKRDLMKKGLRRKNSQHKPNVFLVYEKNRPNEEGIVTDLSIAEATSELFPGEKLRPSKEGIATSYKLFRSGIPILASEK